MLRALRPELLAVGLLAATLVSATGCTSLHEYVHNGFKVGPNYETPEAPVAEHWIDEADERVLSGSEDLVHHWWTVFNDPMLNSLIQDAYEQNLTLRAAGFRVLQARDTFAIARAGLLPGNAGAGTGAGDQNYNGLYGHSQTPVFQGDTLVGIDTRDTWSHGFTAQWELDFWGRLRRNIQYYDAKLDQSVEDYDAVLVTLLADVATNYVQMRQAEQQIEWVRANVKLQTEALDAAQDKQDKGLTTDLDTNQARANLRQTEAQIPAFEINQRQAANRICILLGMPPIALQSRVGTGPIPNAATEVVVSIPAQLLSRRPDVRSAERAVAAQSEQIGIKQADLYPSFGIQGDLGYAGPQFGAMFNSDSLNASVIPQFRWQILQYGRLVNNVRLQDAAFRELVATYQQVALNAGEEVENGIVLFLRSQQRAKSLGESVQASQAAVDTAMQLYEQGQKDFDFNRLATLQQDLVVRQDALAQARAQVALGLIQIYRGLGGGWELRLHEDDTTGVLPLEVPAAGSAPEGIPTPALEGLVVPEALPKPAVLKPLQDPARLPRKPQPPAAADPDLGAP